jgi:hypothetical protein
VEQLPSYSTRIRFSHHAFFTLTYGEQPNIPHQYFWHKVGTDYNRFIQKLRRLHNSPVQAIRAIESHASGNPHLHVLARFPNVLTINNEKYFDRDLYAKWKSLWKGGYLDCSPTHTGQALPVRYLLKYISKHTTTYKTLWRNYYHCLQNIKQDESNTLKDTHTSTTVETNPSNSTSTDEYQNDGLPAITSKELYTLLFCKSFNIKSLSWTRNYFSRALPSARRPETKSLLTSATR